MNPESAKQRVAERCRPIRDFVLETLLKGNRRGETNMKLQSSKRNRKQSFDVMALSLKLISDAGTAKVINL
jgi:hypothetical protein